ncbi:microtubule-actin cross-linking factor 1 [Trichonephila inaurata madagascariensis]|uniref:Microtubule-actin cross-linking factor 1 n=1 Tax=Trichonephila inaurata madagascariensis TaxID=2747483 RepID=A0A8X6XZA5_9ARAC|nr:microtubule-actin cross-linking factor 1 [Trichonephila inaurata madagascariensis]
MDWFDKAITSLSDSKYYHGDLDTVTSLIEQHKSFEEELKNRGLSLESVCKTSVDLKKQASVADVENISFQIDELNSKWKTVSDLFEKKKRNLSEALLLKSACLVDFWGNLFPELGPNHFLMIYPTLDGAYQRNPNKRPQTDSDIKHPRARLLLEKWRIVWLLAMERQRRLQDRRNYLLEVTIKLLLKKQLPTLLIIIISAY